jgi:hypothetical protein
MRKRRVDVSNVIEDYIVKNDKPEKITHTTVNSLHSKNSDFFCKRNYKG